MANQARCRRAARCDGRAGHRTRPDLPQRGDWCVRPRRCARGRSSVTWCLRRSPALPCAPAARRTRRAAAPRSTSAAARRRTPSRAAPLWAGGCRGGSCRGFWGQLRLSVGARPTGGLRAASAAGHPGRRASHASRRAGRRSPRRSGRGVREEEGTCGDGLLDPPPIERLDMSVKKQNLKTCFTDLGRTTSTTVEHASRTP